MSHSTFLVFALSLLSLVSSAGGRELTYEELVYRMIDLEKISVLPEDGENCAQWSSYDRRSQYDSESDRYVEWSANGDGDGFIREEDGVQVLAEMDGPGCIWRIWSARADSGHMKIYLDDDTAPVLDRPFQEFFDPDNGVFPFSNLVHTTAKGKNCYIPIPYQKSCKIVAEAGWGKYFQFTYSTFPKGTTVPSFSQPLLEQNRQALANVDCCLGTKSGKNPVTQYTDAKTLTRKVSAAPGETVRIARLRGPRAIVFLNLNIHLKDRDEEIQALRELVLQIRWDDEEQPSVWTPLGDFFGTAPGINPYLSLPLGMNEQGFYSLWYMPFRKSAKVEIINEGSSPRSLDVTISHSRLNRPVAEYGRFHAKWHRDVLEPAEPERWPDWTLLKTTGRGRYCGAHLHVWSPRKGGCKEFAGEGHWWWGEGDEKFFVDGEKFPSTFGTGTEDYFGYAWCDPQRFENAFHNQSLNEGNAGHISVNRWHIADNVPFQESFEASLEKYFPNRWPTVYAATVYWYLAPDGTDPYLPVHVWERLGHWM
ncbi:MAG TPA: DUF2961 domain-containing protein, partial [bacterium]|nr:DUF2961 domain-containing protein [bacterium]